MDPKKYNLFHHFESNLTHTNLLSPCHHFGYTKYDSTVTHGFGPISMTLDLYDLPKVEEDQLIDTKPKLQETLPTSDPCCRNKCKEAGMEKYYSLAKGFFGTPHCGECCMDPK